MGVILNPEAISERTNFRLKVFSQAVHTPAEGAAVLPRRLQVRRPGSVKGSVDGRGLGCA
jgi:hypothetical protein